MEGVRTAGYDAFGLRRYDDLGSSDGIVDAVGFSGQWGAYTDMETADSTGTPEVLMGARYYDPISARFVSRDPLGDDVNDYTYCGDNPVEHADPDGMDWVNVAADVSAGWGDALTFGATGRVRMWLGANGGDAVRHNGAYLVGTGLGIANDIFAGGGLVSGAAKGGKVVPRAAEIAEVGGRILSSERGAVGAGKAARAFRFATENRWLRHFADHGAEVAQPTRPSTLQKAGKLFSGGRDVLTHTRANGDEAFFRKANRRIRRSS